MTEATFTSCRAVIFDLDGVLVDSEPLWVTAELEAFAAVGLELTPADLERTIGLPMPEVAAYWHGRAPWPGPSPDELAAAVVDRVIELVGERGRPAPGARAAVERFAARGVPLAVASSSPRRLIASVLERFDLARFFAAVASAEDEDYGKPHPAVFLTAAARLGVAPASCLVIEDSINGLIAAKAARMTCVVVPDPRQKDDPRLALADAVLASLEELSGCHFGQ